jgi:hypothetical protein
MAKPRDTLTFINLPVRDVARAKEFFTGLGFAIDPRFSGEQAACVIISELAGVMLLAEPFFAEFARSQTADTSRVREAIVALTLGSKDQVDEMLRVALKTGATLAAEAGPMGPGYGASFYDLDGHLWEIGWMDVSQLAA